MTTLERAGRAAIGAVMQGVTSGEDIARAVLMAVREPTQSMYEAADKTGAHVSFFDMTHIFTAMIDAILAETQEPSTKEIEDGK